MDAEPERENVCVCVFVCIVIYLSVTTVKKYNDPTLHARIKKKIVFTQIGVTKMS